MNTISICVSFIVAILGIAYPILLQVVAGLDEKYSSEKVLELFKKEKEKKYFQYLLFASLIAILIWILKIPSIVDLNKFNFIIENSATYLLLLCTTLLIISFFFFVGKILVYYTPNDFLHYLIQAYNKNISKEADSSFFQAISDILYFSIKKSNETIVKTISDFMYLAFQREREKLHPKPIEYKIDFYEVVYKSIIELVSQKDKKFRYLEYRTVGGIWLLGEVEGFQISERTYNWLWANLTLALEYEREDLIVLYWKNAHQYFSLNLSKTSPEYSSDYIAIKNNDTIKSRDEERREFLRFHHFLGGLLLYRERYKCLSRILNYTSSIPPKYELLPDSMKEILTLFVEYSDVFDMNNDAISFQFGFPEIDGAMADYSIKNWVCKYLAVLFLRQYRYELNINDISRFGFGSFSQIDKRNWIASLDSFRNLINKILNDSTLISDLTLEFLDESWLNQKKYPKPSELINQIKTNLEDLFEKTKIEQNISENKVEEFKKSTKNILNTTLNKYLIINRNEFDEEDFDIRQIIGDKCLMPKVSFTEDQDVGYSNFDSFLANRLSNNIKQVVAETFFSHQSDSYHFKDSDIFYAIDKLKINNDFVIINMGLNISYYMENYNIPGLTNSNYKEIRIINLSVYNKIQYGYCFYIIRKIDLPHFEFKSIQKEQITKYTLEEIDNNFKIFASVIDLNSNNEIRDEVSLIEHDVDLRKSVLVSISMLTEIKWKKNIKNIVIKRYSPNIQGGLLNNLNEVKKFY